MPDVQAEIEVKQAIDIAKKHVSHLFKEDGIMNLGLEEVSFEEGTDVWNITVGFSRPWDTAAVDLRSGPAALQRYLSNGMTRTYKRVRIDATGRVIEVINRTV